MKDERYLIFSEFYNLIKTSEESDDESESSYEEEILDSEPELLEVSPNDIASEESEDPGSEEDFYGLYGQFPREFSGEFSDRAGEFSKELHDKSDEEFAKIIIQNNPSIFFKQMLDKKFPNLVLDGLNMLFLKEGGHEDFFRDIQRNGTPLYKDYPKSVQSFILNKTPVDFYVEYLQDEFPQYKEILGRRWRGVPNNEYGLEEFFRDGTWAINEEETLAKIEQFASDFSDRENAENIRAILLSASPILFSRNKEKLKDIFEIILSQFKPDKRDNIDRGLIVPFLHSKLYKFFPDILNKIIEIISAYDYFSYKVHDLDPDENRIKATMFRFIEAGEGSFIEDEFRTEEIQTALAKRSIIRYKELSEDFLNEKAELEDFELREIYRYLELVNGDNFSAHLDKDYDDKIKVSKATSTRTFSFTRIFKDILSMMEVPSVDPSGVEEDFFEFLFKHDYNLGPLLKNDISSFISKSIEYHQYYPHNYKIPFPIFYKNKLIRSKIREQSPKRYEIIIKTIIQYLPSKWVSHYASESPEYDKEVIDSLRYFFDNLYEDKLEPIFDEIVNKKDWFKKNYRDLESLMANSFVDPAEGKPKPNFLYLYFKKYRNLFPELEEDKKLKVIVDSEEKMISPISAFLLSYSDHFFSAETIATNEEKTNPEEFFRNSLGLIKDYPQHIEFAAKRVLLNQRYNPSSWGLRHAVGRISFILNSKQIPDDIRTRILKSNEFNNVVDLAIEKNIRGMVSSYASLFYDKIRKNIANSIKYYSESENFAPSSFPDLFYSDPPVENSSLFNDLSEMGYRAIMEKVFGDNPDHIRYIQDDKIHSNIYSEFVSDKNLFELFDFYNSSKRYKNKFHRKALSKKLFRSKLFEALSENNLDGPDIVEHALSDPDMAMQFYEIIYMDSDIWNLTLKTLAKVKPDILASIIFLKLSNNSKNPIVSFRGSLNPATSGAAVMRSKLPDIDNPIELLSEADFDSNIFENIIKRFSKDKHKFFEFINYFNNEYSESSNVQNISKIIYEAKKLLLKELAPELVLISTDKSLINKSLNKIIEDVRISKEEYEKNKSSYNSGRISDKKLLMQRALDRSIDKISQDVPSAEGKVDGLDDRIVEMLKLSGPTAFFKALSLLNERINISRTISPEDFDPNILYNFDSEKKEHLDYIAKSKDSFYSFFKMKLDNILSQEELLDLFESSISYNFKIVLNIFIYDKHFLELESRYPELTPIIEGMVIDEIIHNATSKSHEAELFKNDLYKEALKQNKVTLDELLNLYIFAFKGLEDKRPDYFPFFTFIHVSYPDKFNNFVLEIFKELDEINLYHIASISKSAEEYILKNIFTNIDNFSEAKVSHALSIKDIFSNPSYELMIKDLILDGKIIFDNKDSWVKYGNTYVMQFHDFVSKNYVFYKRHKDDLPTLNPSFKLFRKIKNRELAIELLPDLKNEYFLETKAIKSKNEMGEIDEVEEAELNKEINKDGEIKIGESIYQDSQRPWNWNNKTRYTLSLINASPTSGLYNINKSLIHAGDGVAHTNVGVSGFTSAWALFSIQEGVGEGYFVVEQYQSDYPVVLHNIFNAKEGSRYFEAKNNLKKNNPDEYKDLSAHFNVISAAYPYVVLSKAIKTAEIAGFSHIYILKNVGEMASIGNPEKAKKLYEDIPLMIASGTKTIRGNNCWEIEVSKENINKLESKARQVTGKDSDYRFSLTPRQNSERKKREREKKKKTPWAATEEKIQKLKDINLFLKERFPEAEVPTFNKPVDIIKFIQTDIRKYLTKRDFNREMVPIIRELSILKRSWERMMSLRKFGRFCMNKTRVKQIEGMLIRSLYPTEGQ